MFESSSDLVFSGGVTSEFRGLGSCTYSSGQYKIKFMFHFRSRFVVRCTPYNKYGNGIAAVCTHVVYTANTLELDACKGDAKALDIKCDECHCTCLTNEHVSITSRSTASSRA